MPARKATKKKAAQKKAAKSNQPKPLDPVAVEQILKLMTARISDAVLCQVAVEKLSLTPEQAVAAITAARKLMLGAAEYSIAEELGRSILRLNDLFTHSQKMQDSKTALAAQRELHAVFQFNQRIAKLEESQATANAEAEAIRIHLLPLKLAPDHAPLVEHVRVAGLRLSED